MALGGLNAVGGFELPFKGASPLRGGFEGKSTGLTFGGLKPETKMAPQQQQEGGGFDWRALSKFDQKSPVLNGVGSDLGNKFDYMA